MKCSLDDCQNTTNGRCGDCGEPVCKDHSKRTLLWSPTPFGLTWVSGTEIVCDNCMARRREQESRELQSTVK
jgi:hypothetical protein